eukprot:10868544-Alexandrium_andersonii.AAC.1
MWVSVVPCSALALLIGKDVLAGLACKPDFMAKQLDIPLLDVYDMPLDEMPAGHFKLNILPKSGFDVG